MRQLTQNFITKTDNYGRGHSSVKVNKDKFMKKMIYFLFIILLASCSKSKEMNNEEDSVSSSKILAVESEKFLNQSLTEQKLQDYFDLLVLQNKHPDFNDDIVQQIKEISNENRIILDTNKIKIINIQLIGNIQKVSDSIQKMKIAFDIETKNNIKKDSVIAIVNAKSIMLDDKEFVSNKIQFIKF